MFKPDHRMFPVTYVVPKSNIQHHIAKIVAIEVEPKCIDYSVSFVNDHQHSWCVCPSLLAHRCVLIIMITIDVRATFNPKYITLLTITTCRYVLRGTKPLRTLFNIIIALKEDKPTV